MSAGAAAAAAAAQQAKMREEEEQLTVYKADDLTGWEFKIVRSVTRMSGDKFNTLCAEDAQNGWELVEKFDDTRVRFKRRIEWRARDQYAEIDPYRTQYGIGETKFALLLMGAIILGIAVITVIIVAAQS